MKKSKMEYLEIKNVTAKVKTRQRIFFCYNILDLMFREILPDS